MKIFNYDKFDNEFVDAATDDSRRPQMIEAYSHKRMTQHRLAFFISICALAMLFLGFYSTHHPEFGAIALIVAVATWMQVFKCESDLRLLKAIDKLKK